MILYSELKAKRKKSKEESSLESRVNRQRTRPNIKAENQSAGFTTIPLYQNGICFGQKLVPNGKWQNGHLPQNEGFGSDVKTEAMDSEDDLPLTVST